MPSARLACLVQVHFFAKSDRPPIFAQGIKRTSGLMSPIMLLTGHGVRPLKSLVVAALLLSSPSGVIRQTADYLLTLT